MKISSMHDLHIAKMECRHKIELQERAMQSSLLDLKSSTEHSLKRSVKHLVKELAFKMAMYIVYNGRSKNKKG